MSSFDYYTGLVFEAYAPGGSARPLGSGGRYDNMIAAYGESRPAAGFAFFLEQAMAAAAAVPPACQPAEPADAAASPGTRSRGAAGGSRTEVRFASGIPTISSTGETLADLGGPADCQPAPGESAVPASGRPLRIAVPKGSLNGDAIAALAAAGLDVAGLANPGRQLIITQPGRRLRDRASHRCAGVRGPGSGGLRHLRQGLARSRPMPTSVELVGSGIRRLPLRGGRACRRGAQAARRALPRARLHPRGHEVPRASLAAHLRDSAGMQVRDREAARQHRAGAAHGHGRAHRGHHGHRAQRCARTTSSWSTKCSSSTARFFANACAFRTDRAWYHWSALARHVRPPRAQDALREAPANTRIGAAHASCQLGTGEVFGSKHLKRTGAFNAAGAHCGHRHHRGRARAGRWRPCATTPSASTACAVEDFRVPHGRDRGRRPA